MSEAFPPLEALLPQSGPMRLLDAVVHHDAGETRCHTTTARARLFADATGRVPIWVAIELMAQCAAAHGGLLARARGERPRPGLFLGSRRTTFGVSDLAPERPLEVRARLMAGGTPPADGDEGDRRLAFAGAVHDAAGGPPLAEGRLLVLLPRDFAALARGSA